MRTVTPWAFLYLLWSMANATYVMAKSELRSDVGDQETSKSNHMYLAEYFAGPWKVPSALDGSQDQQDAASLTKDTARQHVAACFLLTQERMRQRFDIYNSDAQWAKLRYNVRPDDALRLFFYGDLVTCCSKMTSALARHVMMTIGHGAQQKGAVLVSSNDVANTATSIFKQHPALFQRTDNMPTKLNPVQATAFSHIVHDFLVTGSSKNDGTLKAALRPIIRRVYVPWLAGKEGMCYATGVVASVFLIIYVKGRSAAVQMKLHDVTPSADAALATVFTAASSPGADDDTARPATASSGGPVRRTTKKKKAK